MAPSRYVSGAALLSLLLTFGVGCNIVSVRTAGSTPSAPTTAAPVKRSRVTLVPSAPSYVVPVVEDYLTSNIVKPKNTGSVLTAAFYTYAQEEREDELYYYIWGVVGEYGQRSGRVVTLGSFSAPLIIILAKDTDGAYTRVLGYRQARSRTESQAIRELFPLDAVKEILGQEDVHSKRVELLFTETLNKARAAFSVGTPVDLEAESDEKCINYKFEDFSLGDPYTGGYNPYQIVGWTISSNLNTALASAYNSGPNLAGRFVIARAACGTNCYEYGIVDNATGNLVAAPFRANYGVDFRPDSRLIVVNPYKNILTPKSAVVTSYLELIVTATDARLETRCVYTSR